MLPLTITSAAWLCFCLYTKRCILQCVTYEKQQANFNRQNLCGLHAKPLANWTTQWFPIKKIIVGLFCIWQVSQIQILSGLFPWGTEIGDGSMGFFLGAYFLWRYKPIFLEHSRNQMKGPCLYIMLLRQHSAATSLRNNFLGGQPFCPSPSLPWLYWQEEHTWMWDSVSTPRRQMLLSGEAELGSEPIAPSWKAPLCTQMTAKDSGL